MIRSFTHEKSVANISHYNCRFKGGQIGQPLKKDPKYLEFKRN